MARPVRLCGLVVALILVAAAVVVVPSFPADATYPGEPGRVAYVERHKRPDGWSFAEIHTMDPDGSDQQRITFDGGVFIKSVPDDMASEGYLNYYTSSASPRWLPDGSMLAFMHRSIDDTIEIRVVDPFSGSTRVLFGDWAATMPSWSPDGKRIAYADESGLWTANADGSGATLIAKPSLGLFPLGPDTPSAITRVKWSPDGKRIAFVEAARMSCGGGTDYITVIDADGSNRHPDLCGAWPDGRSSEFDWAPDGRSLACEGNTDNGYNLMTVEPDGSNPTPLTEGGRPAWSPAGTGILYRFGDQWGDDGELWSYDMVSKAATRVSADFSGDGMDWQPVPLIPQPVGLVDPVTGVWRLAGDDGRVTTFYYGNPGDYPIMGDWDCDGVDTPGLYRQSDGYVYLRNSNMQGNADIRFFFGNPGDVPIAGDFNADGCDTVSIYRPSNQRFYVINELGTNDGGLGAADYDFVFGNPGDKPFIGDFNGNGQDTIGLHRESTGLVYYRNTNTQGNADDQFIFGDPGDRLIAGDWNHDGKDSPAVYRPTDRTFYVRYTNTQGNADEHFTWGQSHWLPITGNFGTR